MIPDRGKRIKCPGCRKRARTFTLVSGNTCGATCWTDGRAHTGMLPIPPAATRCRECRCYFWICKPKETEKWIPYDSLCEAPASYRPSWNDPPYVYPLTADEYVEAAGTLARNIVQERFFRIRAWWAGDPSFWPVASESEKPVVGWVNELRCAANTERLLEILDASDVRQQLLRAEIMRQLERFDEAMKLIEREELSAHAEFAGYIWRLARHRDARVRRIPRGLQEYADDTPESSFVPLSVGLCSAPQAAQDLAQSDELVRDAISLIAQEEFPRAESLLTECLAIRRRWFLKRDWVILATRTLVGVVLAREGKLDAAETALLAVYRDMLFAPDVPRACRRMALTCLVDLYEAWNRPDTAANCRAVLLGT